MSEPRGALRAAGSRDAAAPWAGARAAGPGMAARAGRRGRARGWRRQRAREAPGKGKPRHCCPPGECRASPPGTVGGFFQSGLRERGQECRGPGSPGRAPHSGRGVARGCSQLLRARRCALRPSGWTSGGPDAQPRSLATRAPGSQRHVRISRVKCGDRGDFPQPANPELPSFRPQVAFFYMDPPKSGGFHQCGAEPGSGSVAESSRRGENSQPTPGAGT